MATTGQTIVFVILLILIGYTQIGRAQEMPMNKDGKIIYTGIVPVDSLAKEKIYSKVKEWFANQFKLADDFIQLDDKENYTLIGKGSMIARHYMDISGEFKNRGYIYFTMKFQVKDNKYKYEIYNFNHKDKKGNGGDLENETPDCGRYVLSRKYWRSIKESADYDIKNMLKILQSKIIKTKEDFPNKLPENW